MRILAIETSCDETSAAVLEGKSGKLKILSNIISSQINLHEKYGGVVPEVASRAHIEAIIPVIEESLKKAKTSLAKIDAIAVVCGPGLIGSLLVGVNTAKALAFVLKKPLVCINHLEGHIYANFVGIESKKEIKFPMVVLLVSGGHTMLIYMKGHLDYKILGETLDDAAGEAFDKVAKILNLGYPGGAVIEKLAKEGDYLRFDFPRAEMERKTIRTKEGFLEKLPQSMDFSFSGLKTSVLYQVKSQKVKSKKFKVDVSASFQKAVLDVLVTKTIWATQRTKAKSILISGGVAANEELRNILRKEVPKIGCQFAVPPKILSTDNAAMIAAAGYFKIKSRKFTPLEKVKIDPNLKLV